MPITYGMTLAKSWGAQRMRGTVLMKAYVPHTEKSEVFLSYQHADQGTALELAADLDRRGRCVFIDVYDDTLLPGNRDLDDALMTAITNADTMVIIISDETQGSWWVPWEIGVSTPSRSRAEKPWMGREISAVKPGRTESGTTAVRAGQRRKWP